MRHFDFESFDSDITKMLKENEEIMARVVPVRRPGEIGGVIIKAFNQELEDFED